MVPRIKTIQNHSPLTIGANVVGNLVAANNVQRCSRSKHLAKKHCLNFAKDETVMLHDRLAAHRQHSPHERVVALIFDWATWRNPWDSASAKKDTDSQPIAGRRTVIERKHSNRQTVLASDPPTYLLFLFTPLLTYPTPFPHFAPPVLPISLPTHLPNPTHLPTHLPTYLPTLSPPTHPPPYPPQHPPASPTHPVWNIDFSIFSKMFDIRVELDYCKWCFRRFFWLNLVAADDTMRGFSGSWTWRLCGRAFRRASNSPQGKND